jgi:hypothetical protein
MVVIVEVEAPELFHRLEPLLRRRGLEVIAVCVVGVPQGSNAEDRPHCPFDCHNDKS